ncbi:MAG TPA: hypothetical protein VFW33_04360 [Gemmataceae bacterium]|nr:hypothetical protein [Gemmataceae bacterium]
MRRLILRALAVVLVTGAGAAGLALAANPNERDVKPEANVQDFDDIDHDRKPDSKLWVLHFRFKDPRLITVDIPGRGRKLCWYMWYQVVNYTKEPHTFIPDFELVTQDKDGVYHDQVLPSVQEAIRKVEDVTDLLKIKNSVTISAEPVPPSRKDGPARAVTGVAIWDDKDIAESNRYSIFVSGLSNGVALTDPLKPGDKPVIRRKTLRLDFKRIGDQYYQDAREIHFMPPATWTYRAANLKSVADDKKDEKKDDKAAPKAGDGKALRDPMIPPKK